MAHYSPIRVCIYTRVSTSRQADNELSLTDQFERAQQWCDQNGAVVVDQFVEPGASAMDDDRPQFQQMMHRATSDPMASFWFIPSHGSSGTLNISWSTGPA